MNTEDFVTYEQALALKKLGFREKCLYRYNKDGLICSNSNSDYEGIGIYVENLLYSYNKKHYKYVDAPTLAQAQKWLIKNKNIYIYQKVDYNIIYKVPLIYTYVLNLNTGSKHRVGQEYLSNEEALSAGITKCLKLLSNE